MRGTQGDSFCYWDVMYAPSYVKYVRKDILSLPDEAIYYIEVYQIIPKIEGTSFN